MTNVCCSWNRKVCIRLMIATQLFFQTAKAHLSHMIYFVVDIMQQQPAVSRGSVGSSSTGSAGFQFFQRPPPSSTSSSMTASFRRPATTPKTFQRFVVKQQAHVKYSEYIHAVMFTLHLCHLFTRITRTCPLRTLITYSLCLNFRLQKIVENICDLFFSMWCRSTLETWLEPTILGVPQHLRNSVP